MHRLFGVALLSLAACGDDSGTGSEPAYQYGKDDLSAVVTGSYTGTMARSGKPSTTLTMTLGYAAPGATPACGNRVLCVATSSIAVKGTLSTTDGVYTNAAVTGTLTAIGTELGPGDLTLHFSDGVSATVPMTGAKLGAEGNLYDAQGSAGTIALARTP